MDEDCVNDYGRMWGWGEGCRHALGEICAKIRLRKGKEGIDWNSSPLGIDARHEEAGVLGDLLDSLPLQRVCLGAVCAG